MRDGMQPVQITLTQAGAGTNTMAFTLTCSTAIPGVKLFELRQIMIGIDEGVPVSGLSGPFAQYSVVVTQGALKNVFAGALTGHGVGITFPDGFEIDTSVNDTVLFTVNMASATNANTRYCFLRGLRRA